jgi:hypothetical protein
MPDKKTYALIPPEGDPAVGRRVYQVLAAVLADKQNLGLHDLWKKNYKLRRNRHWKTNSANVPLISANLIFTHVQRSVNTLTDNNPIFNAVCKTGDDEESKNIAADIQRAAEDWWQDHEQQTVLEASVTNGETYGIAIEEVAFNADLSGGLGDVETRIVDPMCFGWYPVELKDITKFQNSEAVVEFYVESIRRLRAKYPKLAEKIKSDTDVLDELNDDRREINAVTDKTPGRGQNILITLQNVVRSIGNLFQTESIADIDAEKTVVVKCWYRDDSTVKDGEPYVDDDGNLVQHVRRKYKGGIRYIVACSGGEVVLEDRDNPNINPNLDEDEVSRNTFLWDKFPYAICNSIIDTANAWGISDIEDVERLNMELNKALSQFTREKDRALRRPLVNPRDSGIEEYELTATTTQIRPANTQAANAIKYLEYQPATQDIEKGIQLYRELFLLIAGTFDLDQAQTKSNVIAYKAIAALLERAATMMRGKIRNYSSLIRQRGRMYVSHVQNFYTEDRYVTYKDENGQSAAKAINGQKLVGPINMTVVTGSTMPVSRIQQREEAITLYQGNAIDAQELLEKLDWSGRDEVLKRMMAGPIGVIMDKMQTVGLPPELLTYFQTVAQMDTKDLQKMLESGELPTFDKLMEIMITENLPQAEAQQAAMDAQPPDPAAAEAAAKARKLDAEAALIAAQTATEAVKQEVMLAGVQFDEDKMQIERADAVLEMEKSIRSDGREDATIAINAVKATQSRPGYNERGMKSNNVDVEPRKDGGLVRAGRKYLVGEREPEVKIDSAGTAKVVGKDGPEIITTKDDGVIIPSTEEFLTRTRQNIDRLDEIIGPDPEPKPKSMAGRAKDKADDAKKYLRKMGKDFRKIYSPEAREQDRPPASPPKPISKERAEDLKIIHPSQRKDMNELLDEIDGKKGR